VERVPVVIVGGGPVGLAASLELSRYGVGSLLLERHESTTWHPKARNLNTRTMEIARGWGNTVHDELVSVNLPAGWTSQIIYTLTLAGEELGRMPTAGFSGRGPSVSPEIPLLSSQDIFEPIMRRGAEATGVAELRFGHEAGRIAQGASLDDDRVVVEVTERASGRTYEVEAEYVIAADGAESAIRRQLGIELEGPQGLGHFVNVYFYADLDPWVAQRPAILYFVVHPSARGVFQPLDARGRWLCQIAYDGRPEALEGYTPERCVDWIRTAIGDDACEPEIRSIGTWTMNAAVAERLVQGRVVLAGDAAHQLPPTGGFGVNTGIQGVHNLAWKLALVRSGSAGRGLLDTYDVERRAVGRFNADRSLENSRMVQQITAAAMGGGEGGSSPREAVAASRRYGNFLGMELGFSYESDAVVADGTEAPEVQDPVIDYAPCGRPGNRAPHVWLERDGERRSILDLFGTGFTLLTEPGGQPWLDASAEAIVNCGIEIATYSIGAGGDFTDIDGIWAKQYGIAEGGAVLVRPDGHVAWRAAGGSGRESAESLSSALRQVLGVAAPVEAAR
jgi:2-polyprenyl-6-methoxyphenol hydroxylase-like FAD-dependent oxidoreductase